MGHSAPRGYAGFDARLLGFFIDAVLLGIISLGVVNVVYFVGLWAWRSQTLGQMVVNVRVVRLDGGALDLRTAVLRFLGYLVCVLTLGIGFLPILWDERRQGLHDKIAGTCVVRV